LINSAPNKLVPLGVLSPEVCKDLERSKALRVARDLAETPEWKLERMDRFSFIGRGRASAKGAGTCARGAALGSR
jgi:hypothetical protein